MEQRSPVSRDTATPRAQAAIRINLESATPRATTVASAPFASAPVASLATLPSLVKRRDCRIRTGPGRETHRRASKTVYRATAITKRRLRALKEATA